MFAFGLLMYIPSPSYPFLPPLECQDETPPETSTGALHWLKLLHGDNCSHPCFRSCPRPSKTWHNIPRFAMGSILGGCRRRCLRDNDLGYHYSHVVEDRRGRKNEETHKLVFKCLYSTPGWCSEGSVQSLRGWWSTSLCSRRRFNRDAALRAGRPGIWAGDNPQDERKLNNIP